MREEDTIHERALELMKIGVQAVLGGSLEEYVTKVVAVSEVVDHLETLGLLKTETESEGWQGDIWVTVCKGTQEHSVVEGSAYYGQVRFYLQGE